VGAAADSLPRALIAQLKVGGIMVIPVGPEGGNQVCCPLLKGGGCIRVSDCVQCLCEQWLYRVEKVKDSGPMDETFVATELMGVRYVPLVNAHRGRE
jgi:protein-L-isoaspartate O-methyltransferase